MDLRSLTASDSQLMSADVLVRADGTGSGERLLAVSPSGGIHARVLLDRGLDLGQAWFAGEALSWTSAAGPRRAGDVPSDDDGWHRMWEGGLLTTCGLRHVGGAVPGMPRHGRYSGNPAEQVSVDADPATGRIVVRGTIRENDGIGRLFVVHRTWTFHTDDGRIDLHDEIVNESAAPAAAPLLYHVNLGYPFLQPASELIIDGESRGRMGEPQVVEDEVIAIDPESSDGTARAFITSPSRDRRFGVAWETKRLPRGFSWRRRTPGAYVQAIEPANWGIAGFDDARPQPTLEPGESWTMRLTLTVEDIS
ncbi:DUF4432 family protein [Microbacterium sp. A8/3-1]|uniref:DUF4432 family protein n=1 Tax=Microbacterium sp. A8/3-1 TaxID=3160749 RepID=A0AAU7VUA5_9MICO